MPFFNDEDFATLAKQNGNVVNFGYAFRDSFVVPRKLSKLEKEEIAEKNKKDAPEVGFLGGLKNEYGAVEARKIIGSTNPLGGGEQYIPTEEERRDALKTLGFSLDRYRAVLRGAETSEDFQNNLKIIKGVQEYRDAQSDATLAQNILSGVGSVFGDPLSAVPVFGNIGLVGRVALGGASAMASGQLNNEVSGDDNSAVMDLAYGMAFGAAIEGVTHGTKFKSDATKLGNASRRAQKYLQDISTGAGDLFKATGGDKLFNEALAKAEAKMPFVVTVQGAVDKIKAEGKDLKEIWGKLGKFERGSREVTEDGIHKQFLNDPTTRTAEEARDYYRKNGELKIDKVADDINKLLSSTRMDPADLDELIRRRRDGYKTSLDGDEVFEDLVENANSFYGNYGGILRDREMIGETKAGKSLKEKGVVENKKPLQRNSTKPESYESHWLSRANVADFVDSMKGANLKEKTANARVRVYNNLLRTMDDPEYAALMREKYEWYREQKASKAEAKSTDVVVSTDVPDFMEWVRQEAWKDSLGYVDQGEAIRKGLLENPSGEGMPHNYQHERNPWKFTYKDETGFSVSRLQTSFVETMSGYNMRVSGDLGINEAFGYKSYKEFSSRMDEVLNDYGGKTSLEDKDLQTRGLKAFMSDYYGRSGMDVEDSSSWLNAMSDFLRNITFFSHNAYMGMLNHFEIAEGVKQFGAGFFFKSIPGMPDKLKDWSKGAMTKQERDEFRNMAFGREVRLRGAWREIYDRNLNKFEGDAYKARLCAGAQWLATNSPFTRLLVKSQESIVGMAQDLFVGDLVRFAHGTKSKVPFLDDNALKRLNIPKRDFNKFVKDFKNATSMDDAGRLRIEPQEYKKLIEGNLKNTIILRRLGDYVASETIQRQSLIDAYMWRGSKTSPMLSLLTQFKSFAIRSYNKRLAKSALRIEEGDYAGQAMTWMTSGALGTLSFLGQTFATASGMNEEQRQKYYERVFGVSDLSEADFSILLRTGVNGMSRSSILAAPSMIASLGGFNTSIKSTSGAGEELYDEAGHLNFDALITANVPAASTLKGLYNLQADTRNLFNSGVLNPDDYTEGDRERYARSFGRSLKAILPNAPYLQQSIINYITDQEDN